jgi:hypothetical protein
VAALCLWAATARAGARLRVGIRVPNRPCHRLSAEAAIIRAWCPQPTASNRSNSPLSCGFWRNLWRRTRMMIKRDADGNEICVLRNGGRTAAR